MKAAINALTLALLDFDEYTGDVPGAKEFAERFFADNAELFSAPAVTKTALPGHPPAGQPKPASQYVRDAGDPSVDGIGVVHRVSVVGEDGLTNKQRDAIAASIPLCPNCQQPTNDHLPGCSRIDSSFDNRSVTKTPLPPVE